MTGCPRGLKGDVAMREMLTSYKLALVQMDCTLFEVQANLDKAEGLVREAAAHGAKLICLPEVFQVGYFGSRIPDMMRYAEPEDGPSLTRMRALAKELEVHILAPILFSTPDGIENAAFLLDDQGGLLGHYAKTHPVGDERTYLRRGSRYPVFETKLGRLGVVICYDGAPATISRNGGTSTWPRMPWTIWSIWRQSTAAGLPARRFSPVKASCAAPWESCCAPAA